LKFISLQLDAETERSQAEQEKFYLMQESFVVICSPSADENPAEKALCTACLAQKMNRLSENEKLEFIKSQKLPPSETLEDESVKPKDRFPKKLKLTLEQEAVQFWARGEFETLPKSKKLQFFNETIRPLLLE